MKKTRQLIYFKCKYYNLGILLAVWLVSSIFSSCKKSSEVPGVASLNIFNGIVGTDTLVTNFSGTNVIQWYKTANLIIYGKVGMANYTIPTENYRFNSYSGLQHIAFFNYPDTLAHNSPPINLQLNLPVNSINSLFFSGTLSAPDTLFVRDEVPYHAQSDSVTSIRVVNLVSGLTANINIQGNPPASEVADLKYKGISAFKNYPVNSSGYEYVFEIQDAVMNNLIASVTVDTRDIFDGVQTLNYYRFRSFTIIIYGELGNTAEGSPSAVIMANY